MSVITYRVIKHDGGWAYEANGTFSETFASREAARAAAKRAACEQTLPGEALPIDCASVTPTFAAHWIGPCRPLR